MESRRHAGVPTARSGARPHLRRLARHKMPFRALRRRRRQFLQSRTTGPTWPQPCGCSPSPPSQSLRSRSGGPTTSRSQPSRSPTPWTIRWASPRDAERSRSSNNPVALVAPTTRRSRPRRERARANRRPLHRRPGERQALRTVGAAQGRRCHGPGVLEPAALPGRCRRYRGRSCSAPRSASPTAASRELATPTPSAHFADSPVGIGYHHAYAQRPPGSSRSEITSRPASRSRPTIIMDCCDSATSCWCVGGGKQSRALEIGRESRLHLRKRPTTGRTSPRLRHRDSARPAPTERRTARDA